MSVVQSSGYCQTCGRQSMFVKPRINHVLHLILTIVTIGLWSLVWLTLGIVNAVKGPRCQVCGTKAGDAKGRVAPTTVVEVTEVDRP